MLNSNGGGSLNLQLCKERAGLWQLCGWLAELPECSSPAARCKHWTCCTYAAAMKTRTLQRANFHSDAAHPARGAWRLWMHAAVRASVLLGSAIVLNRIVHKRHCAQLRQAFTAHGVSSAHPLGRQQPGCHGRACMAELSMMT